MRVSMDICLCVFKGVLRVHVHAWLGASQPQ